MVRVTLDFFAPIPIGHHVTAIPLETRAFLGLGSDWVPSRLMILCDDDTRVVYTTRGIGSETMTYESLTLADDSPVRFAPMPPLRGHVRSCVVRSDSGDTVYMQTILEVEPDPTGYR